MSNLTTAARAYAEAKTALDTANKAERDACEAYEIAKDTQWDAQRILSHAAKTLSESALEAEVA
jgi:hypothetical protein